MFHELKRKIRVFISSKIDKKYTPIRRQLQYLLLETGLYDDPFAFEEEYASSIKTIDFYLAGLDDANVAVFLIDNKDGVSAGVREEYQFAKRKDNLRKIYIFCEERSKRKTDIQEELEQKLGEKYATCSNFYEMAELAYISLIQDLVNVYAMPKKPPTQSRNSGDNDNGSGGDGSGGSGGTLNTDPLFTIPSSDSKDRSIDDADTSCTVDTSSTSDMSATSDLSTHVSVGSEGSSASTRAERAANQAATYFIDKSRISSKKAVENELVDYLLSLIDFGTQPSLQADPQQGQRVEPQQAEDGRQAEGQRGQAQEGNVQSNNSVKELSFLKTVLYKDTFNRASFDKLRNSIISSSDERLRPLLNARFDALEAVYNGEGIDKALECSRKALTITLENPFIPQWLVLDVAVDIRNLVMLKRFGQYCGNDTDYQLGQETIKEAKASLFYPVIDRLQENLYQKITETYEKEHLKSPYLVTLGGDGIDIISVFQYIAKAFLIALIHGSFTHMAMIREQLISVLTMFINLYSNRAPVVERIRLHFVNGEKKEKLDEIIRTYHADADILTPEEAREIIDSIKRIRPVVIQTAASTVAPDTVNTVGAANAESASDTVADAGNTQGGNALENNPVRDKQLFYFLSRFGYYCDDNDFSDLFLTLHGKVLKWIDEKRNFDIIYDYAFDFYRCTLRRTCKGTASQKAARSARTEQTARLTSTAITACKETASTCGQDVSCQKYALDFCFRLMDVMGNGRNILYVESLCKLLSKFDISQLSQSDLNKIIDFATYGLNDDNIGKIRYMNDLLVHLMEGQQHLQPQQHLQHQQPQGREQEQAQPQGQHQERQGNQELQRGEQGQEEQPQAEPSDIYLANILRSKLPKFFIAVNTPNATKESADYINECIKGVSACNDLAREGTYGPNANYILKLRRIAFSLRQGIQNTSGQTVSAEQTQGPVVAELQSAERQTGSAEQQAELTAGQQAVEQIKQIINTAIETLDCPAQEIWYKIVACEILMILRKKMDSQLFSRIRENLWKNASSYSVVANYSSFSLHKDQPIQLKVAYALLLISYGYDEMYSSLFEVLFSLPNRQKYVVIKSLSYVLNFLRYSGACISGSSNSSNFPMDKHSGYNKHSNFNEYNIKAICNYVISCSNNSEEREVKLLVINLLIELCRYSETRITALRRLALFMAEGSADVKLAVVNGLERVVASTRATGKAIARESQENEPGADAELKLGDNSEVRSNDVGEEADYYLQSILSQAQLCRHYVVRKLAKEIEDKYHIINRVLDIRFNNGIVSVFSEDGFLLDKARILSIQAEYGQDRKDNLIGILRLTELNIEYDRSFSGDFPSDFSADFAYETEVENKLWNDLYNKEYKSQTIDDDGNTDYDAAGRDDNKDAEQQTAQSCSEQRKGQSGLRWQDKAINKARSDIARYVGVREEAVEVVERE